MNHIQAGEIKLFMSVKWKINLNLIHCNLTAPKFVWKCFGANVASWNLHKRQRSFLLGSGQKGISFTLGFIQRALWKRTHEHFSDQKGKWPSGSQPRSVLSFWSGGREKIIKIEWRKWNWVRKAYFLTLTARVHRAWGNKNCVLLAGGRGRKWQCKCEAGWRAAAAAVCICWSHYKLENERGRRMNKKYIYLPKTPRAQSSGGGDHRSRENWISFRILCFRIPFSPLVFVFHIEIIIKKITLERSSTVAVALSLLE